MIDPPLSLNTLLPESDPGERFRWDVWLTKLAREVNGMSYTVATLPPVAPAGPTLIYVSDETGGGTLAFSDGTNWRRVQDRAIVS